MKCVLDASHDKASFSPGCDATNLSPMLTRNECIEIEGFGIMANRRSEQREALTCMRACMMLLKLLPGARPHVGPR